MILPQTFIDMMAWPRIKKLTASDASPHEKPFSGSHNDPNG